MQRMCLLSGAPPAIGKRTVAVNPSWAASWLLQCLCFHHDGVSACVFRGIEDYRPGSPGRGAWCGVGVGGKVIKKNNNNNNTILIIKNTPQGGDLQS